VKTSRLFSANIGPNIGPNPKKVEVSMNGGISAVDLSARRPSYLRHVGFGGGVTQSLVLDDSKGLLYAADVGLGLVRIVDARKLGGAKAKDAEAAVLQEVLMEPPKEFPLVRPSEDFAVKGRATTAVHSGPSVLALSKDGRTLYVMNRFSGTVAVVDVQNAPKKGAKILKQVSVASMLDQASRRKGEVLYFTDVGRTAVTCDSCHPAGHTGGIMFAKSSPLRVYRAATVRGALETAPYFTPASTFSIGQTVKYVMERNRYGNPSPTPEELEDLARFASAIPTLPNPWADTHGAPPEEITLPDGSRARPRVGLKLFEGKAECISCHPGPHFTSDQDLKTRGKYLDVGTPHLASIREDLQDPLFRGFGVPALVGIWDVFPMFTTGMAGLKVEGDRLKVDTRFPLRRAVADFAPKHGRADLLSKEELNDLLGYVLTL
jgi:cytochrome c peroxidase